MSIFSLWQFCSKSKKNNANKDTEPTEMCGMRMLCNLHSLNSGVSLVATLIVLDLKINV